MKIGIITFHAAHNYGSMLQAYALQQTILGMGHECEIINFRTKRQRDFYRPFYHTKGWRPKLKALLYPGLTVGDRGKYSKFEQFLSEQFILSPKEYATSEELSEANLGYDIYICGSDQIWNTSCFDYDDAYFLNFVKQGKKIAYAPSMGPEPENEVKGDSQSSRKISEFLSSFSNISVREEGTGKRVKELTGKEYETVVDPTFLIAPEQWNKLLPADDVVKEDYVLLYSPFGNIELFDEAIKIARLKNCKLVITTHHWYPKYNSNPNIKYVVNAGPREFLWLIKNARLVISGSFHAVVFSILFNKKFYAVGGLRDNRVGSILRKTGLEQFSNYPANLPADAWKRAGEAIETLKTNSLNYLLKSLSL